MGPAPTTFCAGVRALRAGRQRRSQYHVSGHQHTEFQQPGQVVGRPLRDAVLGVSRGGSFSSNTALPWPPDSSYDSACPATNPYVSLGAAGNQCVTLHLPAGGACSPAPTPAELAQWPCPWNASYSQPIALAVGDSMVDYSKGSNQGDNEHFRVLSIAALGDGSLSVVAERTPCSTTAAPRAIMLSMA